MTIQQTIRTTISNLRTEADRLEAALAGLDDQPTSLPAAEVRVFDPETDTPDVTPNVDGDRTQRDWCAYLLWSQLIAINVRQGRGADGPESTQIAKTAGYRDGRAWNSWNGWTKDEQGGRWATLGGLGFANHYAGQIGIQLPADLQGYAPTE